MPSLKFFLRSLLWISIVFPQFLFAQQGVEMADGMRSSGKIYVVIVVILTILAGIILYIIRLDRKLSRLEKDH